MPKVIAALALLLALAACTPDQPAPARAPGHACEDMGEATDTYRWIGSVVAEDRAALARIPASRSGDRAGAQESLEYDLSRQFYIKQDLDAAKEACAREKGSK